METVLFRSGLRLNRRDTGVDPLRFLLIAKLTQDVGVVVHDGLHLGMFCAE